MDFSVVAPSATDGDSETQYFIPAFGLPVLREVPPFLSGYPSSTSELHLYLHLFASISAQIQLVYDEGFS